MATKIYLSAIDHINNHRYNVSGVPLYYTPGSREVRDRFGRLIEPLYNPEPMERVSAKYSIPYIVDMFFNRVPFGLPRDQEVLDMYDILCSYIDWINQQGRVPADQKDFVTKLKPFMTFLETSCKRICNRRKRAFKEPPTFAEKLFKNVLSL